MAIVIDGVNFLNNADLDGKALPTYSSRISAFRMPGCATTSR
jgi:hypothetical protein